VPNAASALWIAGSDIARACLGACSCATQAAESHQVGVAHTHERIVHAIDVYAL